jgi:hypothetical protein
LVDPDKVVAPENETADLRVSLHLLAVILPDTKRVSAGESFALSGYAA